MSIILRFSLFLLLLVVALPAEESRDIIEVQRALKLYSENYGAGGSLDSLNSVIIDGLQTQNGLTCRVTIHKKRPNLLRYKLETEGLTLITRYNGRKAWLERREYSQVSHRNLSGRELVEVEREARFEGPLYRSQETSETKISFVDKDQVDEIEVFVLRVEERGEPDSLYYLDPATAHLLRVDQLNDAGKVTFQTFYRDYRRIDGYPFAHEVENRVAGQVVSSTQIESIVVNRGILNLFFSDPSQRQD